MDLGGQIVERARKAGADMAEVSVREGDHLSVKVRKGEAELVEEAGSRSVGLRVMRGQQVAVTYTSDLSEAGIARFVEDAIELAALSQPDPFAGPPDPSLLSKRSEHRDLDTYDETMSKIGAGDAIKLAKEGEDAAFAYDKRITNSEGATFTRAAGASALVTSGGFQGVVDGTYASLVVSPVADDADGKKRSGHHWAARRKMHELESPKSVGEEAARRTIAKLGAQKVDTQEVAVIFDPDAARSLLGLLAGCISGGSIWRRSSYLLDRENTEVASKLVTVVDDPLLVGAPGSRSFDGEGLLSRRNVVVENGILKTYLMDTYSAKKLNKASTASASRGSSGGVSIGTTNFVLQPGTMSPEELLKSTPRALYVTDMMGMGFNAVTGDFSRGAAGYWVENGEKKFPVSEVTISLNLDQILKRIDAVASDLDMRTSVASPTIRVSAMTLAGR
ncbi:MAG: TldD/PmbA family protein [Sandaracinaceae bacterium]|nr:TldD/PmbA family protein [Sandaracinaceae bacterium]